MKKADSEKLQRRLSSAGRLLVRARVSHHGGRPPIKTRCERCRKWCESATAARAHCRSDRKKKTRSKR